MSFQSFKKNKEKLSTIESLQEKLASQGEKASYTDDRLWYPARDKATKKGSAVIRFLPVREDDAIEENGKSHSVNGIPWVKIYSHSWKNPKSGKWFIEDCPTTIGLPCPVCEANSELWNTGLESNKQIVSGTVGNPGRKRKLSYISNVLIIDDPANPENNGTVKLFKYGQKIHDMIDKKINPEFKDQKPVNVFDFWEGANFCLRIGQVAGYTNYDASEFLTPAALGDDDYLETVYNSLYKLSEFIVPSRFKSYDDLKTRMGFVLGDAPAVNIAPTTPSEKSYEASDDYDATPTDAVSDSGAKETHDTGNGEDEDDFLASLASLANE